MYIGEYAGALHTQATAPVNVQSLQLQQVCVCVCVCVCVHARVRCAMHFGKMSFLSNKCFISNFTTATISVRVCVSISPLLLYSKMCH